MSGTRIPQCFNPFKLENHRVRVLQKLRKVTKLQLTMLNQDETLVNLLICDGCRLKISRLKRIEPSAEIPSTTGEKPGVKSDNEPSSADSNDILETSASSVIDFLNAIDDQETEGSSSTVSLGESPVKKRKLSQETYPTEKLKKINKILGEEVLCVNVDARKTDEEHNTNILKQLKDTFHGTDDKNLKIRILTLVADWKFVEIKTHFGASKHMMTVAKKVKEKKGILSCASSKREKCLDDELVQEIVNFYESDDISHIMPGKKNYVAVYENGEKVQKQKRLVLCNLKEAYKNFREKFPNKKHSSFSKFAELRPRNCILAGASGTHTVCVCTIHQNVKLMIDGGKIVKLSQTMPKPIATYRDCLKQMICDPPTEGCYLTTCKKCPGATHLVDSLQSAYDEEIIETISYKQWVTVDRATLEMMQAPVPDFLMKLSSALQKLLPHAHIAEQQSQFLNKTKENLTNEECVVTGDFSGNYAFVFQDAIQGVHWNNDRATIHPFVIYYKENSILKHKSFAAISNCMKHDTVAVHLFLGKIIDIIKDTMKDVKKLIYFTDGAATQYKNKKNFINLSHHQDDFGLAAEWHFFATSHGKGPCDRISGTIKRLAARASLQKPDPIIKTPKDLFYWAEANVPSVKCLYFDKQEYDDHDKYLQSRFECAKPITGTKKFHSFIPISREQIEVREISASIKHSLAKIMK